MKQAVPLKDSTRLPMLRHHLTVPAAHGRAPMTVAVDLTPEGDGDYLATCPEFPEIRVYSESEEDALLLAQEPVEDLVGARRIRFAVIA